MINHVLLIDDDEPTNFINQIIINRIKCAKKVTAVQSAREALSLLEKDMPELILLDINMPAMSGWDFLEEFREKKNIDKKSTKVIMLSTSHDPVDIEKAGTYEEINDYLGKPLTFEAMENIVSKHFKDKA